MSIEINFEKLEQLSIADLYALNELFQRKPDKWFDVLPIIRDEINKRIADIFILD